MLNPRTASGGMRLSLSLRPAAMISTRNCSDRKSYGRRVKPVRLIVLLIVTISSSFAQGSPGIIATWTQMGASGNVLARAIVTRNSCPNITLDGQALQMGIRALPTPPAFSVMSCETGIPSVTASASIEGQQLALPNPNPAQFVLWGDTGCRMAAGNPFQACNDPNAWPVAAIANTAAFTFPDLIIHMGDLHYREIPCPAGNTGCAGSPFGFGWDVWNADFFTPAQPLLNAAPWIFVRGNHEYCDKAWDGWFRFLDPYPYQAGCQQFTNPYSVSAGDLQLIIFDSSGSNDTSAPANLVAQYTAQFNMVRAMASPNAWLVHHHPLRGINQSNFGANVSLQTSFGTLPAGIQMVLSGHIHEFQQLNFSPQSQPQLIVGNGGDSLHPVPTVPIVGFRFPADGETVSSGGAFSRFGFTNAYLVDGVWYLVPRNVAGDVETVCALQTGSILCQ
jgi:hypothetical protein